MRAEVTLFLSTFTTLLAIINPLEALPVFLRLLDGKDQETHQATARRACLYAGLLMVFFLVFGNLTLRLFAVPLSMVRMVGGLVLIRIGFSLFMPSPGNDLVGGAGAGPADGDFAFVPLAMPLMFGPGAIATIIGMSALVKEERSLLSFLAIFAAILATTVITYLVLVSAKRVLRRIGTRGIDAATRIVGFFVSAMGMGLIFHGLNDVLQRYGVVPR
jgi:multiple antibiotic resistance protein